MNKNGKLELRDGVDVGVLAGKERVPNEGGAQLSGNFKPRVYRN